MAASNAEAISALIAEAAARTTRPARSTARTVNDEDVQQTGSDVDNDFETLLSTTRSTFRRRGPALASGDYHFYHSLIC